MGPTSEEFLVRDYGVDDRRISVVGGGANLPVPDTPPTPGPGTRLLFVGKEWERKGGDDLLAAFARLKQARPDVTLVLVGSSPSGEVPDGVTVLGAVPHERMLQLYIDADVLVIPTYAEPFGVSFVEALRLGMPCVGTTVGNQRWIIEDAGECVEPGDVGALATALEKVVTNYPAYRERAEKRSVEIRGMFDWDVIADKILTWAKAD
jgi:glycosyltransferase involved in cell wall biosynthesis